MLHNKQKELGVECSDSENTAWNVIDIRDGYKEYEFDINPDLSEESDAVSDTCATQIEKEKGGFSNEVSNINIHDIRQKIYSLISKQNGFNKLMSLLVIVSLYVTYKVIVEGYYMYKITYMVGSIDELPVSSKYTELQIRRCSEVYMHNQNILDACVAETSDYNSCFAKFEKLLQKNQVFCNWDTKHLIGEQYKRVTYAKLRSSLAALTAKSKDIVSKMQDSVTIACDWTVEAVEALLLRTQRHISDLNYYNFAIPLQKHMYKTFSFVNNYTKKWKEKTLEYASRFMNNHTLNQYCHSVFQCLENTNAKLMIKTRDSLKSFKHYFDGATYRNMLNTTSTLVYVVFTKIMNSETLDVLVTNIKQNVLEKCRYLTSTISCWF